MVSTLKVVSQVPKATVLKVMALKVTAHNNMVLKDTDLRAMGHKDMDRKGTGHRDSVDKTMAHKGLVVRAMVVARRILEGKTSHLSKPTVRNTHLHPLNHLVKISKMWGRDLFRMRNNRFLVVEADMASNRTDKDQI